MIKNIEATTNNSLSINVFEKIDTTAIQITEHNNNKNSFILILIGDIFFVSLILVSHITKKPMKVEIEAACSPNS